MKYTSTAVNATPEILKRKLGGELFTPITIKDTAFVNGIVKAGNPIAADGSVANTSSAIGILLNDVLDSNPNGSLVRAFANVNEAICNKNAGITLAPAVKTALPLIVFE